MFSKKEFSYSQRGRGGGRGDHGQRGGRGHGRRGGGGRGGGTAELLIRSGDSRGRGDFRGRGDSRGRGRGDHRAGFRGDTGPSIYAYVFSTHACMQWSMPLPY